MSAVGVIFSNIHDENVPELSRQRTMASIPYGGRYRLIDFALSNFVNSGITTVGVITKNNYQSLMDHLGSGKDWDLARKTGGLILLPPFGASNSEGLYKNRMEALRNITGFLNRRNEDYVVMSDCDGVFRIDLSDVIDFHERKQADLTIVYHEEDVAVGADRTIIKTEEDGRVCDFKQNVVPSKKKEKVFINIVVINRQFLLRFINDSAAHGLDKGNDVSLFKDMKNLKIYGYEFRGYHASIDSLGTYFSHNMELLNKTVRDELFGARDIYTKVRDSAPSKYGSDSHVKNSLISDGCVVEGTVENSILFRGVKIGKGAVIKNSIIMQDSIIGEKVITDCVITDKNVVIRDNRILSGCDIQPYFIPKGTMI